MVYNPEYIFLKIKLFYYEKRLTMKL